MNLQIFPYNSAAGLAWFDQQVLQALKTAGAKIQSAILPDIAPKYTFTNLLPHVSVFNWERDSSNFCYGQFLECNRGGNPLKFWAGLDISKRKQDGVRFILWFDYKDLPNPKVAVGSQIPGAKYSGNLEEEPHKSCWVALKDDDFAKFCDDPFGNAHILADFIEEVLIAV
jgi:hypothetical protein